MTEHLAVRPSWVCRCCRLSWPCPSARRDLAREFRDFPSVRAIYLGALLFEAARDLGEVPPDLYRRFLLWTRDELSSGDDGDRPAGAADQAYCQGAGDAVADARR